MGAGTTDRRSAKGTAKILKHDRRGRSFPIVGLGASAGGLEAVTELLQALPSNPGMAFVDIEMLKNPPVAAK